MINSTRLRYGVAMLCGVFILSACGEPDAVKNDSANNEPQVSTPQQKTTIEKSKPAQVAKADPASKPKPQPKPKPKSTAFGPDILGVRLGMRQDEFEAAAKKSLGAKVRFNPTMVDRNTFNKSEGTVIYKQSAELRPDPNLYVFDKIDVEYSYSQATPKIIWITRSKYFGAGKFPMEANLLKQLSKKYTPPTKETSNPGAAMMSGDKSWFWKLEKDKKDCGLDTYPRPTGNSNPYKDCSDTLFLGLKAKRGIVTIMNLTLSDISEIIDEGTRRETIYQKQRVEAQKQYENQAAKNRPAL